MKLEVLRSRIEKCNRCGKNRFWFFPAMQGVKGFCGDEDYIFACPQPHEGEFPQFAHDWRLYDNMAKYGFERAHLTDLVKCRGSKYKNLTKKEIHNCMEWFDQEVQIVRPKAIIAFGNKAFDVLMSIRRFQPVLLMTHYSHVRSEVDFEKEFEALKYCLDSRKYRHGLRIKDMLTQEQRQMEESKVEYGQFVELLNELRKEEKISPAKWRDLNTQWQNEPHTRTRLLENLKRLQKD